MEGRLYYLLAIACIAAANPLDLLGPEPNLLPAAVPSFLSSNQSINASVLAPKVSDAVTVCFQQSEESALIVDQCIEALVNSDFASLPPTKRLTFTSRSSPLSIGQIGLPRRYHSCM